MRSLPTRAGRGARWRCSRDGNPVFQEDKPMRSLAFKELREVFAISVAALAAYLALVINLMGAKVFDWLPGIPAGTQEVPFTGSGFTLFFTVVSAVFAVALGFRQSAWEGS